MKNKKIIIMLILIIGIICIYTFSFSTGITPGNFKPTVDSGFSDKGGKILGLIRSVATLVSVGVLIILGIKYMVGSVEERAEYKKDMIPYLVGALLVFATGAVLGPIYDIFSKVI